MGPLSFTYITAYDALTETDLLKLLTETPWLKWADWNWLVETNWLTETNQGNSLTEIGGLKLISWN